MKNILYSITIATLAALTLGSCSKSDIPVSGYPSDGVVRISPTLAAAVTRADAEAFNGSSLGLGLYYGDNDKYNRTNSLWTKDGLGNWSSETPVLWKNAEDKVLVYASVPYNSGSGSVISGNIPSDQSAGLDEADWLWYSEKVKPGEALKDGKLEIELKHALLKLTIKFSYGNEFGDNEPAIKEVWLNGTMGGNVNCDLRYESRGSLTHTTVPWSLDIKMHKVSDNCYEAIFYPYTGQQAGGDMLTVILENGRDFHLKLAEDLPFEKDLNNKYYLGGCAYSMSVQVGKDKIVMANVNIMKWETGADGDTLDVEENN